MPRVSDIQPAKRIKAIVVGAPGSGKTEFAATWPSPAFLDTDDGLQTLASKGFTKRHPDVDLSDIRYETFYDEVDKHGVFKRAQAFWDVIKQYNEWIKDPEVKTIVFDSLTSLSVLAMHVGLEVNKHEGKSKSLAKVGTGAIGGHHVLLQTQADYGSEMNSVEQVLDQISHKDKHILVLAHERAEMNDAGGIVRIDPLITGNRLRAKMAQWFDEAWYLEVVGHGKNRKRRLQTDSDHKIKFAKSRLGITDGIDNPTYDKIIKDLGGEEQAVEKIEEANKASVEERAAEEAEKQAIIEKNKARAKRAKASR